MDANHDLEIAAASSQAMHYLHGCYTAGQKSVYDQYRLKYLHHMSILKNLSVSNDQAAHSYLQIRQLESTMEVVSGMEGLIG
jgi:hypothetical protein